MGTLVIGTIIDRARRTLLELNINETTAADVRYDRELEMLPLANACVRAVCINKPSAHTLNASMVLATGAKQAIPAGGTQLANVEHNLGVDGVTDGRAISLVDRLTLTRIDPDWVTATGTAVQHYVHDQRDPKTFYVYPRPAGAWYVNIAYHAVPAETIVANIDTDTLPIDDLYDTPMHDFIVGYALLKNTKAGDTAKAGYFLQRFEAVTGIQLQRSMEFAPLDQKADTKAPNALGKP